MSDDIRKRSWLEMIQRIKRGITGTSAGPMFVASPRDVALLDQMTDYIERSEIKEVGDEAEPDLSV